MVVRVKRLKIIASACCNLVWRLYRPVAVPVEYLTPGL